MAQDAKERIGFGATYFAPLSEEQFADLGKIIAILSFIESDVDSMLQMTISIDNLYIFNEMFVGKTISSKIKLLREILDFRFDPKEIKEIKDFLNRMDKLLVQRNHAVHGTWGYLHDKIYVGEDMIAKTTGDARPAARSSKLPENPLLASSLPDMLKEVELCAGLSRRCIVIFTGPTELDLPLTISLTAHPHPKRQAKSARQSRK